MGVTLRDWYGPDVAVRKARILREMDGTEIGGRDEAVVRYGIGTEVLVVVDDPERPGMADVQLPNGKLVRTALADVELLS